MLNGKGTGDMGFLCAGRRHQTGKARPRQWCEISQKFKPFNKNPIAHCVITRFSYANPASKQSCFSTAICPSRLKILLTERLLSVM
jgi:hypothetical protein